MQITDPFTNTTATKREHAIRLGISLNTMHTRIRQHGLKDARTWETKDQAIARRNAAPRPAKQGDWSD